MSRGTMTQRSVSVLLRPRLSATGPSDGPSDNLQPQAALNHGRSARELLSKGKSTMTLLPHNHAMSQQGDDG
ncbi:MAG: hypothetical protein AAGA03_15350 [Planctomycetota bacterium]